MSLVIFLLLIIPISSAYAQAYSDTSIARALKKEEEPKPIVTVESQMHYPEYAKRSRIEGKVDMHALVETDGTVRTVEVDSSTNDWLKDEAVRAMKLATFQPLMRNGKPIRIWVPRTVRFKLYTPKPEDAYLRLTGISLDSARKLFARFSKMDEKKSKTGTVLHGSGGGAANVEPPKFAAMRISEAEVQIGSEGVSDIQLWMRDVPDSTYLRFTDAKKTGGKVRNTDLDYATVTVHWEFDPETHSVTMHTKKK